MLRETDCPERRIAKLQRINQALIERIDRADNTRSSSYALFQTTAVLEKEILARNRDLEHALAQLGTINRELALARETADEANRAKSRFLRAASHDLLQPLSAAKLFLAHLAEVATDPVQSELVGRIGDAFDSTEDLIRALLEISRLESPRLEVSFEPVSLGRLFQRLAADFQGQADARNLDLRFVSTSQMVISDPVFLRRIAQNLVSNAIKYTERGRVLVGARRRGAYLWLEIHDTGPGIAPEDQERIFNEFERLAPDSEVQGTGLGLSIVRRACLRLDHTVELFSIRGRGSCFRLRMPRVSTMAAGETAARRLADAPMRLRNQPTRDQARESAQAFAGRRVMVIEDDAAMRQAYVQLLSRWGMSVTASDGTQGALAALHAAAAAPDVILTDYQLNRGDKGTDAISALRKATGNHLPALMVTAERAPFLAAQAKRLSVAVLEKPVGEADLRSELLRLLGKCQGAGKDGAQAQDGGTA